MESNWHQAPFLRLVIPLIAGVVTGFFLNPENMLFAIFLVTILICIGILLIFSNHWKFRRYDLVFGIMVTTCIFYIGVALAMAQAIRNEKVLDLPPKAEYYIGEVVKYPEIKERSVKILIKLKATYFDENFSEQGDLKLLAYAPLDYQLDTLIYGDLIVFRSVPSRHVRPINPGQFDYGAYLQKNGIAGTAYFHKPVMVSRPTRKAWSIPAFFMQLQNYCVQVFVKAGLDSRELGVASALVLGKRSLVLPETKNAFAVTGAVHILAVSGLHVGIIYLVIIGILFKVLPDKKWRLFNVLFTLLVLWFYAGITGFSPSVLRAATMFSFIAIGKHSGSRANVYNMLAASAFLLIVLNPSIIMEVGFQLSYLAVLGIVFFFQPIYRIYIFQGWLPDKIWSLIVVSFAAQLATFPISIYYFGQFPNYSLFANVIVIPAAMIALYSGLLLVILHAVPLINILLAFLLEKSLWLLNGFVEWVSTLPFALSDNLHFSLIVVFLCYLSIYLLVRLYRNPGRINLGFLLILVAVLSTFWMNRKISVANAVQLSILKGANESNLVLQRGREAFVFTNDTSQSQLSKAQFYMEGYFDKVGIEFVNWELYQSGDITKSWAANSGLIAFNGYTFWNLKKATYPAIHPDITLIPKGINYYDIHLQNSHTIYIIGAEVSEYQRIKIIARLLKNDLSFWDMKYQGIYSPKLASHNRRLNSSQISN